MIANKNRNDLRNELCETFEKAIACMDDDDDSKTKIKRYFEEIIEILPTSVYYQKEFGDYLCEIGEYKEALTRYSQAIRICFQQQNTDMNETDANCSSYDCWEAQFDCFVEMKEYKG